jgi:hypothetical protein
MPGGGPQHDSADCAHWNRQQTIADSNRVKASLTTSYLVKGAANERAARLKETQQPADLTRDADAQLC